MYYKGKDTLRDKIVLQKNYKEAFRLPPEEKKLLYHYAGMDTIWKILESDTFLARNIRFSNDSEEYKRGQKLVEKYIEKEFAEQLDEVMRESFYTKIQQGIQMLYMICFCQEGDLLSQWRGYAKDGVSLGMDFMEEDGKNRGMRFMAESEDRQTSYTEMFTVLNNQENRKDGDKCTVDGVYTRFVEMPYQVFYVDKDADAARGKDSGEQELLKAIKSFEDSDQRMDMLLELIPYIKDKGFKEETEYRITFNMSALETTEAQKRKIISKKIEYIEKDNCKLPNIVVSLGDEEKKSKKVDVVVFGTKIRMISGMDDPESEIRRAFEKELEDQGIKCEFSDFKEEIYIGEGENQEWIMGCLEEFLQENNISTDYENGIKIWCRGHLPIREIIVGPGEMKEKRADSLRNFVRNTYWLRYVDVKESKIPLQN